MSIMTAAKSKAMRASRQKKVGHFYGLHKQPCSVLDVGVSSNEHNPEVNFFLNTFRYADDLYTGLGIEDLEPMRSKHPEMSFVEYPGGRMPFESNTFEWTFSNAVIEHVGDRDDQLRFINELIRVGRKSFFTTPNKYFPVEAHTNTLFRHWWPSYFYKWCSSRGLVWTPINLRLLSYRDLQSLLEDSNAEDFSIVANRTAGLTMTFSVVCLKP